MATNFAIGIALFFSIACVVNGVRLRPKVFDVTMYGAVANGITDNSQAFFRAWADACKNAGRSRVLIPRGTYFLQSVLFVGPCNGPTSFVILGTLRAPTDPGSSNTWIGFRYIDRLAVTGGGYLDGSGSAAWKYNDCQNNPNCGPFPTTMRFDFITNSRVSYLTSLNSKNTHFNVFACDNLDMSKLMIRAPADSPNTDGIKIGFSSNIKISRSTISTGDDCVAMLAGSKNIQITDVSCGPGHGISIGSLGRSFSEEVTGIHVRNCTFIGTDNGVRIKTWGASTSHSLASNITFQDIVMKDVDNPILIDQQYCPLSHCLIGESAVQIQDVVFKNIWGISRTKVAVKILCSGIHPCKNVKLIDIHLAYKVRRGAATAFCSNVQGSSYGKQIPRCL